MYQLRQWAVYEHTGADFVRGVFSRQEAGFGWYGFLRCVPRWPLPGFGFTSLVLRLPSRSLQWCFVLGLLDLRRWQTQRHQCDCVQQLSTRLLRNE